MDSLRAECLPYCVTAADLADADWPSAVLAEMARTGSRGLYLLVRSAGVPVKPVVLSRTEPVSTDDLIAAAGPPPAATGPAGPAVAEDQALELTVVICTRDRPVGLRVCLEALQRQTDPGFEVLVIDNTEAGSPEVAAAVAAAQQHLQVRLIHEPSPGLSNARNAALGCLTTELVGWIDDDEEADTSWVASLKRVLRDDPAVSCVVGEILPARLATSTDLMFEEFGGYNKRAHRVPERYTKQALGPRIFYPLPSFGTGGNMAMRSAMFDGLPRFDADLGAGTRCRAGEDTLMFSEMLDAGHVIAYEPSVVTWHHHRESVAELAVQLDGYGRGLGAYYMALLLRRPLRLVQLLVMAPRALVDQVSPHSVRNSGASDELLELRRGNRWAILQGAATYLRLRLTRARRVRVSKRSG